MLSVIHPVFDAAAVQAVLPNTLNHISTTLRLYFSTFISTRNPQSTQSDRNEKHWVLEVLASQALSFTSSLPSSRLAIPFFTPASPRLKAADTDPNQKCHSSGIFCTRYCFPVAWLLISPFTMVFKFGEHNTTKMWLTCKHKKRDGNSVKLIINNHD